MKCEVQITVIVSTAMLTKDESEWLSYLCNQDCRQEMYSAHLHVTEDEYAWNIKLLCEDLRDLWDQDFEVDEPAPYFGGGVRLYEATEYDGIVTKVIRLMGLSGADIVRFDCDGEMLDGFEQHNW